MKREDNQEEIKDMKIGILMGGFGDEREVSLLSGQNLFDTLVQNHYNVIKIDPAIHLWKSLQTETPDILLNVLHGPFGEDGTIQAILEYLKIPFVGETPLSSGLAMHKIRTKEVLNSYGIPSAPYYPFYEYNPESFLSPQEIFDEICDSGLNPPFFLKDAVSGSSKGVWKIQNAKDLARILPETDFSIHPSRFFVEEGVEGREISVGVYRNLQGIQVLPIAEIETGQEFFNFEAKYAQEDTQETIPAQLPAIITSEIHSLVKKIYAIMEFRGCVRIDFILDENSNLEPVLLEINNQPGMTKSSLIPVMLEKKGIKLIEFLLEQISIAMDYPKPLF